MREIKFRAFFKNEGIMVYEGEDRSGGYDWDLVEDGTVEMVNNCLNDTDYEWMQFTGLHDRNGKEIYEGDVIRHSYYSAMWRERVITEEIVQWDDGHAGFNLRKRDARNYEILGNIHEHPHLIKG